MWSAQGSSGVSFPRVLTLDRVTAAPRLLAAVAGTERIISLPLVSLRYAWGPLLGALCTSSFMRTQHEEVGINAPILFFFLRLFKKCIYF